MPTHVALLRGINLGGRNRVAMAELREVVASLGHTEVATYIQSGNVVFTAAAAAGGGGAGGPAALATALEEAISGRLGVSPRVVVRTREELARVVRDNPYPDEPNPKAVHAIFLSAGPDPELSRAVAEAQQRAAAKGSYDTARLAGQTLYLHTPDGFGRSLLAEELTRLGGRDTAGTARNWSTVTKLLAMCSG